MSKEGFFAGTPLRSLLIGWSILLGPFIILILLARVFLRPEPIAPELVYGCYTAENAPWLEVEPAKIRIGEPKGGSFAYVVEPAKEGYRLTVSPAMALILQPDGNYEFRNELGIGYF